MAQPQATGAGYSLLELLVVMAIMAMIVVMAVPFTAGTVDKFSLASDARLVAAQLHSVRDVAVDMQRDVAVSVTSRPAFGLETSEGQFISLSPGTAASILAPGGRNEMVISWDGSMAGSIILSRAGKSTRIYASQLNGPLHVEAVK